MKSFILLILLLGLIKVVFCAQLANVTENGTCPVSLFRRKRAIKEYTRWRSNMENMEKTPEFIVKVLDDMPLTTKIMALHNIFPSAQSDRKEKIIIGGAMVPPLPSLNPETARDYTRFQPPTDPSSQNTGGPAAKIDSLQPKLDSSLLKKEPVYPAQAVPIPEQNINRDESPPSEPQFLKRLGAPPSPNLYQLIAPVAFTLQPTNTLKDNGFVKKPSRTSYVRSPTRTSPLEYNEEIIRNFLANSMDNILLTRTLPTRSTKTTTTESMFIDDNDDFLKPPSTKKALKFYEDDNFRKSIAVSLPTRTSLKTTTESMFIDDNDDFLKPPSTKKAIKFYEDEDFPKSIDVTLKQNTDNDIDIYRDLLNSRDEDKDGQKNNLQSDIESPYLSSKTEQPTPEDIKLIIKDLFAGKLKSTDKPPFDVVNNDSYTSPIVVETVSTRGPDKVQSPGRRIPVCNMITLRNINFNTPRTLPEIVTTLQQWADESALAKLVDVTGGNLTTLENPIHMMIVDDPSVGQIASEKQTVLLVAGIQGRDHYAVASAMFVLYHLIERSDSHFDLLSKYRFWIIPVFNPDGYDYSMTFPNKREWMKNLRQMWDICPGRESCHHCDTLGLRCAVSPCYGVNLDRNFEYQWMPPEEIRAEHPCGKLYPGPRQLSEPETQSLTNFLHKQQLHVGVFIAFKEGDVFGVMYPHSHTHKKRANDEIYRQRAGKAAASAFSIAGRNYVAGQTSEFLPLYAGGIEDWADGHLGIDNTYTIMMLHSNKAGQKKALVERTIHEVLTAMDSLLLQSIYDKNNVNVRPRTLRTLSRAALNTASRHCNIKALFFLVFISTLFNHIVCHTHNYELVLY